MYSQYTHCLLQSFRGQVQYNGPWTLAEGHVWWGRQERWQYPGPQGGRADDEVTQRRCVKESDQKDVQGEPATCMYMYVVWDVFSKPHVSIITPKIQELLHVSVSYRPHRLQLFFGGLQGHRDHTHWHTHFNWFLTIENCSIIYAHASSYVNCCI